MAADELLISVRSLVVFVCLLQAEQQEIKLTQYSMLRFSERGSQGSLRGSAEAADLLPEHSAGSRVLQMAAALGICGESVKRHTGVCV